MLASMLLLTTLLSFALFQKVWKATQASDHVTLSYTSPDGDEHFPGSVHAKVTYQLTPDNVVIVSYDAHVHERATPINLASHPYFNLGGEVGWARG